MQPQIVPVYGPDGDLQLHDMYVGGEWLGSRRAVEQCKKFLMWYGVV